VACALQTVGYLAIWVFSRSNAPALECLFDSAYQRTGWIAKSVAVSSKRSMHSHARALERGKQHNFIPAQKKEGADYGETNVVMTTVKE
jgi:hypothetical protein